MEPGITEEIPVKSVDPCSKPELPLLFLICILFLRVTRTYKEDLCFVLLLYKQVICRFFLKRSRFPVSLTLFAFTARSRFISFAMHENRPKLESCT